ncbi:MAG: hypothetical protein QM751_05780 [Paludibacteraceae bacterium]
MQNTSGMPADRLRVLRRLSSFFLCRLPGSRKTKEAESSPASLDRLFRYKVSTEVFFLCGTKVRIFPKKNVILFGFNHSIYGHWLADVQLAVFAPANRQMPIASFVMGK